MFERTPGSAGPTDAAEPTELAALTDLSERIFAPGGREVADELLVRFSALREEMSREMQAGAAVDRYENLMTLRKALEEASRVVVALKTVAG